MRLLDKLEIIQPQEFFEEEEGTFAIKGIAFNLVWYLYNPWPCPSPEIKGFSSMKVFMYKKFQMLFEQNVASNVT